jgi:hypothetical protein
MVKSEKEAKRTTRRSLWRELLWRKPIVFLAIAITFASTADWLWDEVVEPFFHVQRPKLLDLLRWLPWYEWVIIGLILMVILVGEHAFKLINQAESESIQHAKGRKIPKTNYLLCELLMVKSWQRWPIILGCKP